MAEHFTQNPRKRGKSYRYVSVSEWNANLWRFQNLCQVVWLQSRSRLFKTCSSQEFTDVISMQKRVFFFYYNTSDWTRHCYCEEHHSCFSLSPSQSVCLSVCLCSSYQLLSAVLYLNSWTFVLQLLRWREYTSALTKRTAKTISLHLSPFFLFVTSRGSLGHHRWFDNQFPPFSVCSTALWDLTNSRPVHSPMLSSYLVCLPCLLPPYTPWGHLHVVGMLQFMSMT